VVKNPVQGIVRDEASHFIEKLADRHFLTGKPDHPCVSPIDGQCRADGRDEEVSASNTLIPEKVEALLGDILEFLPHVIPQAIASVFGAFAANQEDGR